MISNPVILKRKLKNFAVFSAMFLLFGGLSFVFIRFAQNTLTESQNLQSRATQTSNEVKLTLAPDTIHSSKGSTFTITPSVVLTAQNKIGFIYLSLRFDPSHLKFISLNESLITPGYLVLKKSDLNEINSTGILNLMAGISKDGAHNVLAVNLPPMQFEVMKESQSTISFNITKMQIVFADSTQASLTADNEAKIDSNQTQIPTPSNTPTFSPASNPSDNPISSTTPSPSTTPTPSTPTPSDTPTPSPTLTPAQPPIKI